MAKFVFGSMLLAQTCKQDYAGLKFHSGKYDGMQNFFPVSLIKILW